MPPFRTILAALTSVMVMCNALLCMCGPALASAQPSADAGAAQRAPVNDAPPRCHGHAEEPDPSQDSHDHRDGCGCHSSVAAPDLKSAQPTLGHAADLPVAFMALLPAWHSPAHGLEADRLRVAGFAYIPPPGQTVSLLRLHCALIL